MGQPIRLHQCTCHKHATCIMQTTTPRQLCHWHVAQPYPINELQKICSRKRRYSSHEITSWLWPFIIFFCELHNTSETLTTHTHPYEYTHANPTPRSIFEDCAGKSSRLTKSPHATRCRREHRLPLKAQTLLNLEKFAPTGSRTQDLRSYRGSCNC
jgi:hypothetical protein